jgi:hypothetical protein
MDAKLKAKWVKALRSGKFKQGDEYLKGGNRYCCLGVLATIQGAKWRGHVPFVDGKSVSVEYNGAEGYFLSPSFCGLRHSTQDNLANMNDGRGKYVGQPQTFEQIADYIERRL